MHMPARAQINAFPSKTLLALSLAALGLQAHAENVPLSLTVSETLSRDSNLFRVSPDQYSIADTVSSTGLKLALDKSYGRQRYTASLGTAINRYFDDKQLDNTSYDLSFGTSSEFADKGLFQLSGSATQNLARFDVANQNSANDTKNTQRNSQVNAQFSYGGYGALNPYVSISHFQQGFTSTNSNYQATNQNTYGLGTSYAIVPQLSVGTGIRLTRGTINYDDGLGGEVIDNLKRRDIDLYSNWIATGLSTFYARISSTHEKDRYDPNPNISLTDANSNSLTGEIKWNYTPQGRISYTLDITRDKGNVGRNSDLISSPTAVNGDVINSAKSTNENNRLSNIINGRIDFELTHKIKLNTSLSYTRYHLDQSTGGTSIINGNTQSIDGASASEKSRYTIYSIGGQYEFARWANLYCDIKRIKRTRDAEYTPFNSTVTACTGQFNINGMN